MYHSRRRKQQLRRRNQQLDLRFVFDELTGLSHWLFDDGRGWELTTAKAAARMLIERGMDKADALRIIDTWRPTSYVDFLALDLD